MNYPTTAAEWWCNFDAAKDDLRALVRNYHPWKPTARQHPISATIAEKLCEDIRAEIAEQNRGDPIEAFDRADIARDAKTLVNLLSETWFCLPESYEVRSISGFHVLCDLCSESSVLNLSFEED